MFLQSFTRFSFVRVLVMVAMTLAVAGVCALAAPGQAQAKASAVQMETAYKRSVKAILDYRNQPSTIQVKVSDLGLTNAQKQQVQDRVHYTGEYFWVNTLGEGRYSSDYLLYPCEYSDATITSMRKKFESRIKNALSCFDGTVSAAQRVHLLHDWLIKNSSWVYDSIYGHKSAYGTIAGGKGDCLSYCLGMQVLLKRAGFTTLYVQNMSIAKGGGHAWNLVRIGTNWYHVDATWDESWSGTMLWKGSICHRWLLQPDAQMRDGDHDLGKGWTVFYKGAKTTAYKARSYKYAKEDDWEHSCARTVKKGTTFTNSGITYKTVSKNSVYVTKVSSTSKRRASSLSIRATVPYKGRPYTVVGIKAKAFKGCKATSLKVYSTSLAKSRVKSSLTGSRVSRVYAYSSKVGTYKNCFAKSNCGRTVSVRSL